MISKHIQRKSESHPIMKKFFATTLFITVLSSVLYGQNLTQTVRGTITDADSKQPLIGAGVIIQGSNPLIGTVTDIDGVFRLEKVPVGRVTIQLSYLGYEKKVIPNVLVSSGKEVVLNLDMQESVIDLKEVEIKAEGNKGEAINEMSLISARSISAEETSRYAGGFNDPSRIVSSFAGVATTGDGGNDIIVRGNSPKYIQWRLEGVQITNPNHFADQNSVSGAVSTLNNNLLATSDFYTGAFSPEYGDVLSGIYDVKLREGNNQKFESVFGLGILGTDLTLEGPFKKGYNGSFLINYRYSTASFIDDIGLIDVGGVPKFQDMAFKVALPTKNYGKFSLFGLGGWSSFLFEEVTPNVWNTPGDRASNSEITEDYEKGAYLANTGLTHVISVSKNAFLKSTLAFSAEGISDDVFESRTIKIFNDAGEHLRDSVSTGNPNFQSQLRKSTYRGATTLNLKLNARHKLQVGTKYALFDYDFEQSQLRDSTNQLFKVVDFRENISTVRNFISWKFRLNENITLVSGLHNMNVLYNNKSTLEPRVALKWQLNPTNSFHAGYGSHSNMESIHNYFAKVERPDGTIVEPNQDLGLLKAHHYVIGYEKRFSTNLLAKVEVYYQDLYNLPVENNDTSFYATINEGVEFRYVDLVNEGTGRNYGVEVTFERFFSKGYYYFANVSVFESKYKALDGKERNTAYNGNYLFNILAGKEFDGLGKKQNRTLGLNTKIFFGGGKKVIPLLRDEEGNLAVDPASGRFYDYNKAYEDKIEDIYQVTLSASYKVNRPKATHEIFLNLDNLTNHQGRLTEYYDESEPNSIGYSTQFGFFPNLLYRVYF